MEQHLLAWGELLDAAGWCVAVSRNAIDLWLSQNARLNLRTTPANWQEMLKLADCFPPHSLHSKNNCVLVWSRETADKKPSAPTQNLTPREKEILSWLRQGKTGPEIAIILDCALRTVEKHVANLYRKIGARTRTEAILKQGIAGNDL